jgi:lysozyme
MIYLIFTTNEITIKVNWKNKSNNEEIINYTNKYSKTKKPLKLSDKELLIKTCNFIADHESFRANRYRDGLGYSIGFGHKLLLNENINKISLKQAIVLLENDVILTHKVIHQYVKVILTDEQKIAVSSFIYNVGRSAFINSTLLKELNNGNYNKVEKEFTKWIYSNGKKLNGLINRRNTEVKMFNKNICLASI